jgi:KipI family sensor histidine kinase inhibitor
VNVEPRAIEPFGDRALLIRFEGPPSPELTALLTGLAEEAARLPGVLDAAPGLTTVLVESDGKDLEGLQARIPSMLAECEPLEGRVYDIDARYNGPDLEWACAHLGISQEELIELHSTPVYDVRLLGSPGFIYLSDVASEIALPRLEQPRKHVPAGSIGIGGAQTGIYGRPRPGGWRILASAGEVPAVRPGDRVKFVPS